MYGCTVEKSMLFILWVSLVINFLQTINSRRFDVHKNGVILHLTKAWTQKSKINYLRRIRTIVIPTGFSLEDID